MRRSNQLCKIGRRCKVQLIQATPVLGKEIIECECPAIDVLRKLWIIGVHEEKDAVVMEVGVGEGEEILEVVQRMLVPLRDGRIRDDWHRQVLWDICKEHINPRMYLCLAITTVTASSNLQ